MMSKKQWSALLCLHVVYLFLGASIFYHIENPLETQKLLEQRREKIEIQKLIYKNYRPTNRDAQEDMLSKLTEFCGLPMLLNETIEDGVIPIWDFYHAFFFSYTVISTVGYGNLAPTTSMGRIIMIFYALFGVPMNGILFANLGGYFATMFRRLYSKYKEKNPSSGSNIDYQIRRFGFVGQITMYLVPGFLFFIFMPACLFVIFEDWDYTLAVYYAFVTLTTIGFGDYVAAVRDRGFGIYFKIYEAFLIFWITFGLGYLVMVIGFLTQGLRSPRVLELEHKLATHLKETQSKIWHGVTKDVSYLRRILNEVYMMRFKPVYHDEIPVPRVHRSSSCPSLSFTQDESPKMYRRRANSEVYPMKKPQLQRVQSDTDLLAIDRTRTFEVSSQVQPAELLARVVDALGSIRDDDTIHEEDGFHCFSDDEILASERTGSGWSIGGERISANPPTFPRKRAVSEIKVPVSAQEKVDSNGDLTWTATSSTEKIREQLKKVRRVGKLSVPCVPTFSRQSIPRSDTSAPKSILSKLNPFKRRDDIRAAELEKDKIMPQPGSEMSPAEYLKKTTRGRISMAPLPSQQRYLNKTRSGRPSRISLPSESADILEQTTVADLIRALEALHSNSAHEPPRRKMGTASLTPPRGSTQFLAEVTKASQDRRFSILSAGPAVGGRRQSIVTPASSLPPAVARRRFSLHPMSGNSPTFTPTLTPLVAGSVSRDRRGSLLMPPPYTPVDFNRRRALGGTNRRLSLWGPNTPSPRPRRPHYPPSISEGTAPTNRTRHESLNEIRIELPRNDSYET